MENRRITSKELQFFKQRGYLTIHAILDPLEVNFYLNTYNRFLKNEFDLKNLRSDLSGSSHKKELITQIMHPSKVVQELKTKSLHQKSLSIAKQLLGSDMKLDFDMLINKPKKSNTPTPWHQDAAYWIQLPDKRALSIWVALDEATIDNGCMWYTPQSHLCELKQHHQINNAGALECKGTEENSVAVPLPPGSCVIHQGNTLHYSRGNSTNSQRRAFILNFRPATMIKLERSLGFDHTGRRKRRGNVKKS